MRGKAIAGNWKMNKDQAESSSLITELKAKIGAGVDGVQVIICPPFTSLALASELIKGSPIKIGAQNMYHEDEGAFTGEISPKMLKSVGCTYVILGHSERRQYFDETDEWVEKKTRAAVNGGLEAIVCVGEMLAERDAGQAAEVVRRQVRKGLGQLTEANLSHIIVAYEPVWAIGTGRTATPEIASGMHAEIRKTFAEIYNAAAADALRILYGGSVKPGNISALMKKEDIDGALVGGASLDPASFAAIIKYS